MPARLPRTRDNGLTTSHGDEPWRRASNKIGSWRGAAVAVAALALPLAMLGPVSAAAAPALAPPVAPVGVAPQAPAGASRLGALASATKLQVTVTLQPSDPAGLAAMADAVSTPGNSLFRHYLSTAQFAARFGPTPSAVAAVDAALTAGGLRPGPLTANHLALQVTATAAQLAGAFQTGFATYHLADGRTAYANTSAPLLPATVAPLVQGVIGLDDLVLPQRLDDPTQVPSPAGSDTATVPHVATGGPQPCSAASSAASSQYSYTADQLASAYRFSSLYGAGDLGAGQTVALYELEPNLTSDIAAYQSCYGTSASVSYTTVDGGPGTGAGEGEAALDIEDVIGLAPQANVVVYQGPNTDSGAYDTYNAIIEAGTARVVSTSWGDCEPAIGSSVVSSENTLFQEAATHGQTIVAAAGDNGSEDCYFDSLAVDDPASQPYVTGVGGTTLSAIGPPPTEKVWNEKANSAGAGGGGISTFWTMPTYQSGAASTLNVINADSSASPCGASPGSYCREVPDVSADADPYTGYIIYYDGRWIGSDGTSAAAPLWAAFTALTNASASCAGTDIGFANLVLYQAAANGYSSSFNDIVSGNNDYTGTSNGKYPAGPGYDMASGLGTPDGAALPAALCTAAGAPGANTVMVTNPGSQTGTVGTAVSLQIHASDSASGQTLTYSATGLPAGLSISNSGLISGSPTTAGSDSSTVTATDTTGAHGSASFTWTINDSNTVTVTNPASQTGAVGTTVSLQIHASDSASGQTLTYGATGLPAGLSMGSSSGLISGIPTTASTFSVTVTATDTTGAHGSASFSWTISNVVMVTNPGSQTGEVATAVSVQIHATDSASGQTLTFSATGLPAGLSISSSSGLISGIPTTAGSYSVTVTVSDPTGVSGSASFAWAINKGATTTAVVSSANPSVTGQPVTYTANVASASPTLIPTGTVTFDDNGVAIGSCTPQMLSGAGSAACTVSPAGPAVSTQPITAIYGGDSNFDGSTSATLDQVINKAPTKLVASAQAGLLRITFTATLTRVFDGADLVGQSVSFSLSGRAVCTAATNGNGVATCSAIGVFIGKKPFAASYAGGPQYLPASVAGTT
jgi:kumamolisin